MFYPSAFFNLHSNFFNLIFLQKVTKFTFPLYFFNLSDCTQTMSLITQTMPLITQTIPFITQTMPLITQTIPLITQTIPLIITQKYP